MSADDRVIVFPDGSTLTLICDVNWWTLPVSTIAALREAVETLSALGSVSERPKPADRPELVVQSVTGPLQELIERIGITGPGQPDCETPIPSWPCIARDCGRTFASDNARRIHHGKAHKQPVDTPVSVDVPEAESYECHDCSTEHAGYNALAAHTKTWHKRYPTANERHHNPRSDSSTDETVPPLEADESEPDEPAAVKAYWCDDCTTPIVDGRELFKHTEREHGRVPHAWERQQRYTSERAST